VSRSHSDADRTPCFYRGAILIGGRAQYPEEGEEYGREELYHGQWRAAKAERTFERRNPANVEEVIGVAPQPGHRDAHEGVLAARQAFGEWRKFSRIRRGDKGLRGDSLAKLVSEQADYVVFNGSVGSLMGENALKAAVGDTVRVYFGVGGPNVISSFHVIGEVFDRVYPEGALENPHYNVQTTLIPAGGATVVEFKIDVPGTYLLVDHSLSRLFKGAVGQIVATGPEDPAVFGPVR
jgi:hypothetical protein